MSSPDKQTPLNILFAQEAPCIRNYKMATALRSLGHRVTLAYTKARLSQMYKGLGDDVYNECVQLRGYRHLWELSLDFDLIHCHNEPDLLTVAALAGEVPVVHDTHDLISLRSGGDNNLTFFEGVANRGAHGRVYSTPFQRDEARQLYGVTGPSLIFYNYASKSDLPSVFHPKLSAGDGATHIVYEGGVGGTAHRDFIQLFVTLAQNGIHVHIHPTFYREDLAKFFGQYPQIHYYQPESPKKIIEIMTRYDYGLIPFNLEKGNKRFLDSTIANKLFEYLAAGLPVAASALRSYVDFFSRNPVGLTFNSDMELIQGLPRLKQMADSIDFSQYIFTYEKEIGRMVDFYRLITSCDQESGTEEIKAPRVSAGPKTALPVRETVRPGPAADRPTNERPPAEQSMDGQLADSFQRFMRWVDDYGWDGYDPYDLPDYIIQRHKQKNPVSPEEQKKLFQRDSSDPMGLRADLGIEKKRNAKALGLLASARVRLFKVGGDSRHLAEAASIADWLLQNPSPGYPNLCWGYPFDWQSVRFIPRGTPSAVVSTVVGDALWELYTVGRDRKHLEACLSICRFITENLNRDDMGAGGLCFSYTPLDDYHVHNSNLFCGEFLARIGRETGREDYLELAGRAAEYARSEQNDDGSIFYWGRVQDQYAPQKLDHYHTGFELRCLFALAGHLRSAPLAECYRKYLEFYLKNFLLPDFTPKITPGQPYPVNIHGAAEAVLMLSTLSREHPELLDVAGKVLNWTVNNMQTPEGWFAYLWAPGARVDAPFLRWGQAWMLKAFVEYQAAGKVRSGAWGYLSMISGAPGRKAAESGSLPDLWRLASEYLALGEGGVSPRLLQDIAAMLPGPLSEARVREIKNLLGDPEGWRKLAPEHGAVSPVVPEKTGAPEAAASPTPAAAPLPGDTGGSPADRAPAADIQIMMPNTQGAAYGSKEWAEKLYTQSRTDPWGHDWRASQQLRYVKALEMIDRHISPREAPQSILDIGCALGHFTVSLKNHFTGSRVTGVDISEEAVRKCRQRHRDIDFMRASLPDLELDGRTYDFISALEVIFYIKADQIDRALARIHEALNPGGWLLISTYLNKPPFKTSEVFRGALSGKFSLVDEVIRHHGLYNQTETQIRQAMAQLSGLSGLLPRASRDAITRFVQAGVDLLGDMDLAEQVNTLARERVGAESISHSIVLARRL